MIPYDFEAFSYTTSFLLYYADFTNESYKLAELYYAVLLYSAHTSFINYETIRK